jgi:hypothetical protein
MEWLVPVPGRRRLERHPKSPDGALLIGKAFSAEDLNLVAKIVLETCAARVRDLFEEARKVNSV